MINESKSSIFCSSNTKDCIKNLVGGEWPVKKSPLAQLDKDGLSKVRSGLGFWDLESYNSTLLAKQMWQIITRPHSLVASVFKDKYFKHDDVIEVKLRGVASFLWRSIAGTREVIHDGARWRLGKGANFRILKDKWLSSPNTFQVQLPSAVLLENFMVKELFSADRS